MGFNFLTAIKNIAPIIVGTFGTPLAGVAVKALCDFIPDEPKAAVQQAQGTGGTDGAISKLGELFQQGAISIAQVKQAEDAHREKMAELGYKSVSDLAAIAAQDTASARAREIALKDKTPAVLAAVAVSGAVLISLAIVSGNAPAMKDTATAALAGTIVGYIFGELKLVFSYYFGSSADSKAKTQIIGDIAKDGS